MECCINTVEVTTDREQCEHAISFIKHWPTDEEQTVILHVEQFYFWGPQAYSWRGQDVTRVKLWGETGLIHSVDEGRSFCPTNIGFVVKIRTNTRYTITENDFTFPAYSGSSSYKHPNPQSTVVNQYSAHMLQYWGIANEKLSRIVVSIGPVWDTDPARVWYDAAVANAFAAKAQLEAACGGKHKVIVLDHTHATPDQIHSIVNDRKVIDPDTGQAVDGITDFYRIAKGQGTCDSPVGGYMWQNTNPPYIEHPTVTYANVRNGLTC